MDAQFSRCWRAIGARNDDAAARVAACWSEPHRHYHNREHLEECLGWLEAARAFAARPHELAVALYFHDAVYDPARTDNEAASAQLFAELAHTAGIGEDVVTRIRALISSTARHDGEHGDTALLSDIDLSILGAAPARYARFERDIRREYARYDDEHYRRGRAAVLSLFLSRFAIYKTPFFARLEAQARDNLAHALRALAQAPASD
ncbi:MAG TPA: hypothetical protein VI299_29370 [Polyangiales bacterium]